VAAREAARGTCGSAAKLPIIGVEVPLMGSYVFVPWLSVILHLNLLIHLELNSKKLKRFIDDLKPLEAVRCKSLFSRPPLRR
jgi:hypothetical protein